MTAYTYTHQVLGRELEAISGHYAFQKEGQLPYKGRQVYYYTGYSSVDTSCCGPGGCGFAFVIGYMVSWHLGRDASGAYVSEIEPLADSAERQDLTKLLMQQAHVQQVNFWTPAATKL